MLYLAAAEAGIDPSPHFKVVADLSGSEPDSMGATLEAFERSQYFELTVKPQLPNRVR